MSPVLSDPPINNKKILDTNAANTQDIIKGGEKSDCLGRLGLSVSFSSGYQNFFHHEDTILSIFSVHIIN